MTEVTGCRSVAEAKASITYYEFIGWLAYFALKQEAEQAAMDDAKAGKKPGQSGGKVYKKKVPIPD